MLKYPAVGNAGMGSCSKVQVSCAGYPPLQGWHMLVCSYRWYTVSSLSPSSWNRMRAFLRDTPGKQPPCLHERIFAGQRTANGISRELSAVSRGSDGGRDFPYPIFDTELRRNPFCGRRCPEPQRSCFPYEQGGNRADREALAGRRPWGQKKGADR